MRSQQNSKYFTQFIKNLLFITFSIVILNFSVFSESVDPTFNPIISNPTSFGGSSTILADGKILVYGNFKIVEGVRRNSIARLNPDGSLDTSFNCTACDFYIGSAVEQSDGKIMIGGALFFDTGSASRIRRLNPDGSIDNTFTSPFPEQQPILFTPVSKVWAVRPDGKIIMSQNSQPFGEPSQKLYRLNPTGSIDSSFTTLTFNYGAVQFGPAATLQDLKLLPDGKLLIGGKHNFGYLFRVNTDGTKDTTFESPNLTRSPPGQPFILSFDIQSDGKIPLYGVFSSINGVSKTGIARLNADQSLDETFTFPVPFGSTSSRANVRVLSGDKILISGSFLNTRIVRLNSDGSLDKSFSAPSNIRRLNDWTLDTSERIIASAEFTGENFPKLIRLNADGSLDTTIDVEFGTSGRVNSSTVQADGKIIIFGNFNFVDNVSRRRMARLDADGNLDTTFTEAGSQTFRSVYQLVAQPDGKILAVGNFLEPRDSFVRLNADGNLDSAFNPAIDEDVVVADVQTDGKILIGGVFTTVDGTSRTGLARLNADGSLDTSFNPVLGGDGHVFEILAQADGKIVISGRFTSVNGTNRDKLARLNADGTLDTSFDGGTNKIFRIIERQSDGKYLISDRDKVYRRNANGSTDSSFTTINFDSNTSIRSIVPQTDGTILVGGSFIIVNSDPTKKYLVKLAPNGTLQSDFLPDGVNDEVWTLSKQPGDKIIVGGEFTTLGGESRLGIARLENTPLNVPARTRFDYDGDGKSDVSVFRPSNRFWFVLQSGNGQVLQENFGINGDILAPADYDGDGKTDLGIFRPSTGSWWYLSSIDNTQKSAQFGADGDIPMPSDINGDGADDFVVFRPAENNWYRATSDNGTVSVVTFGAVGDKPVIGDFDGDGKADPAVFRPSDGNWWWESSIDGIQRATNWGLSEDIPVPADYDGDGITDFAVYRPSEGGWYIDNSSDGSATTMAFGVSTDIPVPADYDGDGKADIAVFRPQTGIWYLWQSTDGSAGLQWGVETDIPTQSAFLP